MHWLKRPIWESGISSDALATFGNGHGFCGGYTFDLDLDQELDDDRKSMAIKQMALHKALIQETDDDWETRHTAFLGKGEIQSLIQTGPRNLVALNVRLALNELQETLHFIAWEGKEWKEISSLPCRASAVWESGGSWVLIAGYPQESFEPVLAFVSSDGAHSWKTISLSGFNPLETSHDYDKSPGPLLFPDGILYRISAFGLERLDLKTMPDSGKWDKVRLTPPGFRPVRMARRDSALFIFGKDPAKGFAMWFTRANGTGAESLLTCHGIPKDFDAIKLVSKGDAIYMMGRVSVFEKGEMRGFEYHVLKSSGPGTDWENLQLPIKGSLDAFDIGLDGRVWAIAAGNRMQVGKP